MKVLCIGEALIDMICTDKGSALSDGTHFLKKAGGAPMNVAAAIAALSVTVKILDKHQKMKNFVVVVLYLWEFGLLVFSLFLSLSS
jgi:hypothetical protein